MARPVTKAKLAEQTKNALSITARDMHFYQTEATRTEQLKSECPPSMAEHYRKLYCTAVAVDLAEQACQAIRDSHHAATRRAYELRVRQGRL